MSDVKVEKLSKDILEDRGVFDWPIWRKGVSRFDWSYDTQEQCYFLEGRVTIETPDGKVEIKKGDFVTFPQGLKCVWNIHEPVKKHYNFD